MYQPHNDYPSVPHSVLLQANKQCDRFEVQWKAGNKPRIEDFVAELPVSAHPRLLWEFIRVDWEYRERLGDVPNPCEYVQRFPNVDEAWFAEATVRKTYLQQSGTSAKHTDASNRMQQTAQVDRIGDYLLLDKIGEGGMGAVYRARHQHMERIVALKMLSPNSVQQNIAANRFRREIKAAGKLMHPNIVTAHDAGEQDGVLYLVMEYVDGEDLHQRVVRNGPMSVAEAVAVILQAAEGLNYSHKQNIIHRDIKPANLLLDTTGSVKVLDLGLARIRMELSGMTEVGQDMSTVTTSRQIIGTPHFMAPEQSADPRKADKRSDIYSLGCTLYFLLTGKPLFPATSPMDVILAHRNASGVSLRSVLPDVPDELDQIFRRMVARNPDDRFADMSEVIRTLQPFTASKRPSPKSWPKISIIVGVGLVVILLLFVVVRSLFPPEPTPKKVVPKTIIDNSRLPLAVVPFSAREAKQHQERWAKYLQVPVRKTTSFGMELVLIPPGKYSMGSTKEQFEQLKSRLANESLAVRMDEIPCHEVTISKPFWMGVYEVTVEQFTPYGATHKTSAEEPSIHAWGLINGEIVQRDYFNWKDCGDHVPEKTDPVANLSWNDAQGYCHWLTKKEGHGIYRLPTEAEWEYACRAGSDGLWCFGSGAETTIDMYAWHGQLRPKLLVVKNVGLKSPNAFGLYDMHGNVIEWCRDRYGKDYYKHSPSIDPKGPTKGKQRVFRGGSVWNFRFNLHSARRNHAIPNTPMGGFRVVLPIEE